MADIIIYSESTAMLKELLTLGHTIKVAKGYTIEVVSSNKEALETIASLGADKIVFLKGDMLQAGAFAKTIASIINNDKSCIGLFGSTLEDKRVATLVASAVDCGLVTDATSVVATDDGLETERMTYGGLAVAKEVTVFPALVTIPAHSYDAYEEQGPKVAVEEVTVSGTDAVTLVSVEPLVYEGQDISSADKLVVVGRGLTEAALPKVEEVAKSIGAEIGCTRPVAEDNKWYPLEKYIGISGKTVKPDLYLGLAVAGQIQHVAGMRESKVIVAVNTEETAPIFNACDYGIVGDAAEFLDIFLQTVNK